MEGCREKVAKKYSCLPRPACDPGRPWHVPRDKFDGHGCAHIIYAQVCVAHGVLAWELGRAASRAERHAQETERSRQGEIGLTGAARTRGVLSRCIYLFAHTTLLPAQIAKRLCAYTCADSGVVCAERFMQQGATRASRRSSAGRRAGVRALGPTAPAHRG